MNRIFFSIVILILSASKLVSAQKLVTVRLVDKETKQPLKDATVFVPGTDFKTTTNTLGFFQVETKGPVKLQINSEGYIPATVEISGEGNAVIEIEKRMLIAGYPVMTGPSFPGGMDALHKYIKKNIDRSFTPPPGKVVVRMVLDSTGAVIKDSVTIVQSLCKPCDRAALKLMKKSPKWDPGESNGNVSVIVPIMFK